MSYDVSKLTTLLTQLKESKAKLIATLTAKGEEVSPKASFYELIQQAADHVPKSYLLIDDDGKGIPAVLVDEETIFTAKETDVREGKIFVNDAGVKTGTKIIPSYNTTEGFFMVLPGGNMSIPFTDKRDLYDYTKFQAIICPFNTSLADSVGAEKVSMNDKLYHVQSTNAISNVTKDTTSRNINLGIKNESGKIAIIYYVTYKEIY